MMIAELEKEDPTRVAAAILEAHRNETDWLDEFADALDRQRKRQALDRILTVWRLSQSEAATLFGVSRQALGKWLDKGVPAGRAAAISDLSAATDLLVRHLKSDRIQTVVRRRADALDGRSLIDLVAASETRKVLDACRSMFDFQRAQT